MGLKLVVLVGSVRSDPQSIKAARYVDKSLRARGHEVATVDPILVQLPLLDRFSRLLNLSPSTEGRSILGELSAES